MFLVFLTRGLFLMMEDVYNLKKNVKIAFLRISLFKLL